MRKLGIGLAGALALTFCGFAAVADEATTPEVGAVDALQALAGKHPGKRANHAKGIMLDAVFTPTARAAQLSKAVLFAGPGKAVVRFSDPLGFPDIPDGDPNANPHGMAVQFTAPGGDNVSMVMIASKLFPVATAAEFRDLILAFAATRPDSPKPTPAETFLAAHPAALAYVQQMPGTPESFASETYYGLDAFRLVAKDGGVTNVRFRFAPEAPEAHLSPEQAKAKGPNFLIDEIGPRAQAGGVKFKLVAQIGAKADPTGDATKTWPDDREIVELGELVVTNVKPDSAEAEKAIVFMPTELVDGIDLSDDPLPASRAAAYAESYGRRQ